MTKKPKRSPTHREAVDPDEIEEAEFEEAEAMPDEPEQAQEGDELKHPDPEGKMRSYAPGYGPGPGGTVAELPKDEKKDA